MNTKNSWNIAHWNDELFKAVTNIDHHSRFTTAQERLVYKTGLISYYTVDSYCAIFKRTGECISGDLKEKEDKAQSTETVMNYIHTWKDHERPPFTEEEIQDFLYFEQLMKRSVNKLILPEEFKQFKQIYHALQRHDYDTVVNHLSGKNGIKKFEPRSILLPLNNQ